jgi:hypothetical protein
MRRKRARLDPVVTARLPRSPAGFLSLILILILVAMMVFVWLQVARTMKSGTPPPTTLQPASLVWGNRVFQTEAQLKRWVEGRGLSYSAWVNRHRGAVAVIEHRPLVKPPPAREAAQKREAPQKTTETVATKPRNVRARPAVSHAPPSDGLVKGLGWTLALLLAAVAFLPRQFVLRVSAREFGIERRTAVAAAALAVGFGLLAAGSGL